MKRMARLFAALLVLAMLCSLVGCATTYEEFSDYSIITVPGEDDATASDAPGSEDATDPEESTDGEDAPAEIGRASCRERV